MPEAWCSTATRRTAIRNSITGQMAGGILPTLMREGGVAALLILALAGEGSESLIGLSVLIMQWSMLVRLFAAPWVDRARRKRFLQRWLLASSVISALLLAGPMCGAAGRPELGITAFLLFLAAYFLTLQIGVTAWFPLLSYIVPSQLRGRYFGSMRRAWQITSFGAVFVCGWLLGKDPEMLGFIWVMLPAVLLQFGRVLAFARLPDPPPSRSDAGSFAWRDMLIPLRDPPFLGFVCFALCTGVMQFAAVPFVVPFLRTCLGFPAATTLYGSGCFGLGSILSVLAWGRLADRGGTRVVFLLSGISGIAAMVTVASAPAYALHPVWAVVSAMGGMMLAGSGAAGIGIAYTVRLMRMAPATHPSPYLNFCQAAIGLAAGIVAAVIGAVLSWVPDQVVVGGQSVGAYRVLFLGVGLFMAVVMFAIARLPRLGEPRLGRALAGVIRGHG
jgi:MFS family permease